MKRNASDQEKQTAKITVLSALRRFNEVYTAEDDFTTLTTLNKVIPPGNYGSISKNELADYLEEFFNLGLVNKAKVRTYRGEINTTGYRLSNSTFQQWDQIPRDLGNPDVNPLSNFSYNPKLEKETFFQISDLYFEDQGDFISRMLGLFHDDMPGSDNFTSASFLFHRYARANIRLLNPDSKFRPSCARTGPVLDYLCSKNRAKKANIWSVSGRLVYTGYSGIKKP